MWHDSILQLLCTCLIFSRAVLVPLPNHHLHLHLVMWLSFPSGPWKLLVVAVFVFVVRVCFFSCPVWDCGFINVNPVCLVNPFSAINILIYLKKELQLVQTSCNVLASVHPLFVYVHSYPWNTNMIIKLWLYRHWMKDKVQKFCTWVKVD